MNEDTTTEAVAERHSYPVLYYVRHWRGGHRWLHNPRCYICHGTGADGWRNACSCGEPYDEAPQEWRDLDELRRAALAQCVAGGVR